MFSLNTVHDKAQVRFSRDIPRQVSIISKQSGCARCPFPAGTFCNLIMQQTSEQRVKIRTKTPFHRKVTRVSLMHNPISTCGTQLHNGLLQLSRCARSLQCQYLGTSSNARLRSIPSITPPSWLGDHAHCVWCCAAFL